MRRRIVRLTLIPLIGITAMGCQKPVYFPVSSNEPAAKAAGARAAYDVDADGRADCFFFADPAGRVNRIGYDRDGDQKPEEVVDLDAIPIRQCRHLVIVLDGFGYDVVKRFHDEGGLRVCYPPSRVIAPYPTLTDLCIEDLLGYVPCQAFEAKYYDRRANRVVGGNLDYLAGANQPYNRLLQYRANMIWDAIGYVLPWPVFGKEINDSMRLFRKRRTREVIAYYVSSAGMGTRQGAVGQRRCLEKVEQLVNQVVWEARGLTKVTILSDHGHSYTPSERIDLEDHLERRGWRLRNRLEGPRDAVYVRYGLETYASFSTRSPAALAADLASAEGVDVVSYAEGDTVVVQAPGGKAVIRRRGGRYAYEATSGDPLKLKGVLAGLSADPDGYYDADALLAATATHEYPDAMVRLWRAHFALAENVPDVIVSLKDEYFAGSRGFAKTVSVASTHGGLNARNSTAFIMSSVGPLPPVMRSADVPARLQELTGLPFPLGR